MTIILGDCLEELKKLGDNSIDTVITSPPYNLLGLRGKAITGDCHTWRQCNITYKDDLPEADYRDWQIAILDELHRVIKPTGSIFYNHKVRRTGARAHHPWEIVRGTKAKFYQQIVWDRGSSPNVSKAFLFPSTELIFWFTKEGKKMRPKIFRSKAEFKKEIWPITPKRTQLHPASFPDKLVENCINLTTVPGDLVLDPFAGIGTVGIVATRLQRDFILIDVREDYLQTAVQLIQTITPQVPPLQIQGLPVPVPQLGTLD